MNTRGKRRSTTESYDSIKRRLPLIRREAAEVRGYDRPKTRGDCLPGGSNASRPCPWAGCRYHLLLDLRSTGGLTLSHGHDDPTALEHTCALDVADKGDIGILDDIADKLSVTREGARLIEERALRHARRVNVGTVES